MNESYHMRFLQVLLVRLSYPLWRKFYMDNSMMMLHEGWGMKQRWERRVEQRRPSFLTEQLKLEWSEAAKTQLKKLSQIYANFKNASWQLKAWRRPGSKLAGKINIFLSSGWEQDETIADLFNVDIQIWLVKAYILDNDVTSTTRISVCTFASVSRTTFIFDVKSDGLWQWQF